MIRNYSRRCAGSRVQFGLRSSNLSKRPFHISCRISRQSSPHLSQFLAQTIEATGPISLAAYMKQCLTNPSAGYYINRDPFGKAGDFITSPEISQMFGEMVGIWILTQWISQGRPDKIRLVEFGPGRGTLMDDLLRFQNSISEIHMIEASPTLREMQRSLLCDDIFHTIDGGYWSTTKAGARIYWFDDVKEIPRDKTATFIVAHEFFDALPIHQFEHTDNGWREYVVDYSVPKQTSPLSLPNQTIIRSNSNVDSPKFHLTLNPRWTPSSKIVPQTHPRYSNLKVGSKVEICPDAWNVSDQIASLLESGGAALIVDYGPADTIPVNSLRAIKNHKIVSPFNDPGECDLSTDVDFQAIKIAATKSHDVEVYGPVEQGDWLHNMGIGARTTALVNNQTSQEAKKRIESGYTRLVEKAGGSMGKVYKVMSIVPSGVPEPVGFGGDLKGI